MAATVATPLERQLGRIAGVNEITSSSSLGSTRVVLQFDLNRNINDAAIEVQAAINAARSQLPTGMPNNPTYRKVNPAAAPIMVLTLTSDTLPQGQMYDAASTVVAQKLSQVAGVGQVTVSGSALPAVRVELNPTALNAHGIGLGDVRNALAAANANRPKGLVEQGDRQWWIYANDQARTAAEYRPLIVAWRNGAPVRLADVADVVDSVQDTRNAGSRNGRPAVLLTIYRQPNANILETVQRVQDLMPWLRASLPAAVDLEVALERTSTIRASINEVQKTLGIAVGLVILVVFVFLRRVRAALIPAVAVPVSIVATFGFMYLAGYSLNNLSLMALIVATGFVVDDAIVVLENATRHIEAGMSPMAAAARERARGELHGALDERVADRGVHPDPLHGRPRRALLPRVRGHALGRGPRLARRLAHAHADDVRATARARRRRAAMAGCTSPASGCSPRFGAATSAVSRGRSGTRC